MDKNGKWSLSPAYDMGFAYNPAGGWTAQHQMSINGKFDDLKRNDLIEFAQKNNIKDAPEIIDRICDTVADWQLIAAECGIPSSIIKSVQSEFQLM